jgi:hypothetical protein
MARIRLPMFRRTTSTCHLRADEPMAIRLEHFFAIVQFGIPDHR